MAKASEDGRERETETDGFCFSVFLSSARARETRARRLLTVPDGFNSDGFISTRAEGTKLKPLRYYNSAVHGAAFVLPEFARAAVEPFVVPGTGFS